MRKSLCFFLGFATFVMLTGCEVTKRNNNNAGNLSTNSVSPTALPTNSPGSKDGNSTTYTIKNYYPFKSDIKYYYEGRGNEYAEYNVYVDYLTENRMQIRVNNGGTETVKVLENKDGELRLILSKAEVYYRENFTNKNNDKPEVLLKEPLVKGTSWVIPDGRSRSITDIEASISTPVGTYKCIEVTTVGKDDKVKDYYAIDIGLVKTIFTNSSGGSDSGISSTLSKQELNIPLVQTVKFYYPNVSDDVNYVVSKKLSFNTNDITKEIFEKYFREIPNSKAGRIISANTQINSLYLNSDNMVYVDFSKEFVSEMNAGTSYESMILQCIANTLGDYYMVTKVYITVEGNPYSSGHIIMKKGEAFISHPQGERKIVEIE